MCDTRRIVTGLIVSVCKAIIAVKIGIQKIDALSTTEAEIIAMVQCVQEILYIMKSIESLGMKIRKSMMMHSDNKGAVDLMKCWW